MVFLQIVFEARVPATDVSSFYCGGEGGVFLILFVNLQGFCVCVRVCFFGMVCVPVLFLCVADS